MKQTPCHIQRIAVILFFVALFACSGYAQFGAMEPNDPLPHDPSVITGTLPNGLHYYIRKNSKPEKRAELRLAVKAGSVLENDDQRGLAHFCEHMCFNGTKRFPKQKLVNFLESTGIRFGAHINAYTSFDETVYMLQVPTDKPDILGKGMDVLEDWAGAVSFDNAEIDKERGVVIEEWRLGKGANERVRDKLLPTILFNSRYAVRLPIGQKGVLDTFKYATIKKFYHDWYRPDLMSVIAVGDFEPAEMEAMIKSRFSRLVNPKKERERTIYTVPEHNDMFVAIATDKELPTATTDIYFMRDETKTKTVGDYRSELASQIYDAMLGNRLHEISQKPDAPFTYAYVNDGNFLSDRRTYQLSAGLKSESLAAGYEAILKEAFGVKQNGFTATELERQKKDMMAAIERQYKERDKTESRNLVQEYLQNFLEDEPYPGIAYEYELFKKYLPLISLQEVNALSDVRIGKASRVVTLSAPDKPEYKMPSESQLRNLMTTTETAWHMPYDDKVSTMALMPILPQPGKIISVNERKPIGVTEWTLSNGIKVVVKPTDFKNDEILVSAIAPGGSSLATDDTYLSAEHSAGIMSVSGVSFFDVVTLQKMLAGKTVSVNPTVGPLQHGFTGSAAPKDLETMFQLLYLYSTSPRRDPQAFGAYKEQFKAYLQNRSNDPASAFNDTIQVTMSNYHRRVRPFTTELLKEVDLNTALAFYENRIADMSGYTFYFVGSVNMPVLQKYVETYIASLRTGTRNESWKDVGVMTPKGHIEKKVFKGIEPKSNVRIILTGAFDYTPENRFFLQSMAEVLSIKLRETLREEKGGVYGVGVRATPMHYPKPMYQLSVSFGCAPERVDELVAEVNKKLDTMMMKPPEETYVIKVKEIAKRELETSMKENRFWLGTLSQYYFNGENPEEINKRSALIESLSAQKIFEAAKKYCNKANYVKVVLYPEKK